MLIAALVTFAVLLAAWVLAPTEPALTTVEPLARPVESTLAEAA
jgi:hypothetical protein